MFNRYLVLSLLALAPIGLLPAQAAPAQLAAAKTDVPVKNVVLFSSGVGYFEHAGTVRGDGSTELRFKTSQINDILKSLVLQDQDGGKVTTITYPSEDPLAKTLRSFQVDITGNPSLADLLNQLRGAKVTIESQAQKLSGTILGVETRRKPVDKGEPIDQPVLNVLTGGTIHAVDLESITSLSLDDPQLQEELAKALAALSQARDQDEKPVTINFTGTGERHVRIGYVVEAPVWKTSYRLLLDDKGSKLQGWAIVENQTENDWNGVSLSLVSGRPISFIMDLYQPLYATRPTVVQELFAGLRPQVYSGGIAAKDEMVPMTTTASDFSGSGAAGGGARGLGGGGGGGGRGGGGGLPAAAAAAARPQLLQQELKASPIDAFSSVQSLAQSGQLGELFQYTVDHVTLPRQKSAMLPIVTDSIAVERLSIYNASVLASNPLNGVRLKNTTGKDLLHGPITVLDKGSYAGDARIDDVPPGQDRLLSYGIDLEMLVDNTKQKTTSDLVTGRITKGVLIIDRRIVASQDYLTDNKGSKDKTIVIEHPIRQGWTLVDSPKPIETTPALYRFQGTAVAKKVTTLTVKEQTVQSQTIAILSSDGPQLVVYSRSGEIPKAVRDALDKAIQLKQALTDTQRQITDRTQQITSITQEQERIREDMKTVAQTTQYYERLLAKLNDQETSIEKLQGERDTLNTQRDAQQKDLNDYVSNLTLG